LLSGWRRGQALKILAADGSAEAVRVLEESVAEASEFLQPLALETLERLASEGNVAAKEALCRLVMAYDEPRAREIVTAQGYLPHNESHRALFFFLTNQWAAYEALDFDHRLLREAYDTADAGLRRRIAAQARQAGRVEWVDMVSGGKQGRRLGRMTEAEWRTALSVLEENQRYAELWRLAQEAPPRWSAPILRLLKRVRWQPRPEERAGFEELARLAKGWQEDTFRASLHHRATLLAHTHEVRCLAIDPRGRLLASASTDRTVRLWSLPDGELKRTLKGHSAWVSCLAVSPNGQVLASAGRDRKICLWSLPEGTPLGKLKGHTQPVFCLAITPDSRLLLSGSADRSIRFWDLKDGSAISTLKGHKAGITCLALSPEGTLLATGSADSTIRLWSVPEGRLLRTLEGHRDEDLDGVLSLTISPNGKLLISGGTDHRVMLWRLPSGRLLKTLKGHFEPVASLVISPNSRLLVSGAGDHDLLLWRLPSGRCLATLAGQTGANSALVISPDGNLLACSSGGGLGMDHTVRLWNLRKRQLAGVLQGHSRAVSCLAMSPDGLLLASGSGDSTIRLWSAELPRLGRLPIAHTSLQDLEWVQGALASEFLSEGERRAFAFLAALMRWRRRLDILVDEAAPRVVELGAFDIELEG
jgi:hypothetical protein